jgi:hypothetical protein
VLVTVTGHPHYAGRAEARGLGSLPLPDNYTPSDNAERVTAYRTCDNESYRQNLQERVTANTVVFK